MTFTCFYVQGASILCGGERVNPGGEFAGGHFIAPTVVTGMSIKFNCQSQYCREFAQYEIINFCIVIIIASTMVSGNTFQAQV